MAPSLPHFFKLPVFIIPLELSAQSHQHFPSASFVLKTVLGVSFNTQSQAPHIPGFSSRASFSYYTTSLQAQAKAPDIQFLSLRASTEELLASFNSQGQAPDDPSTQDCCCVPLVTVLLVFFNYHFVSHLQGYRLYRERSLMIIGRSFHRETWWYIGHLLLATL